jgi:hypothetical protein
MYLLMGKATQTIHSNICMRKKIRLLNLTCFSLSIGNLGHYHVLFVIAVRGDAKHVQDEDLLTG